MPIVVPSSPTVPVTAESIIRRAMRLLNVLAAGETPGANEKTDALDAMNSMLDAWRNESLMVYALRDEALMLTGAASYTIGDGGDLNTARPVKIETAFYRANGFDYPVRIADALAWARIASKSTSSGVPDWLYYAPDYPAGHLYMNPNPPNGELHLVTWTPLTSFAASDPVALPPGYQEAITFQLASRLAIEYGKAVPVEVAAIGSAAKKDIKRVNFRVPHMNSGLTAGRRFDIRADA